MKRPTYLRDRRFPTSHHGGEPCCNPKSPKRLIFSPVLTIVSLSLGLVACGVSSHEQGAEWLPQKHATNCCEAKECLNEGQSSAASVPCGAHPLHQEHVSPPPAYRNRIVVLEQQVSLEVQAAF